MRKTVSQQKAGSRKRGEKQVEYKIESLLPRSAVWSARLLGHPRWGIHAHLSACFGKTETTNPQSTSDVKNEVSAGKDQMACKCSSTTSDLDKLIASMNGATADKKVDAIAAAVTKLAQELKTQQQPKTTTSEKSGMDMCKMMMGMTMNDSGDNDEGDHEHHH